MTWIKLDDQFPDHPKVMAAGPLAAWLYVCGLAYCARLLTDGYLPAAQVRKLADVDEATALADRLVGVGLWERVEGGFRVHDYLEYQPSADRVRATREVRAAAGSRGGYQKASNLLDRLPDGCQDDAVANDVAKSKQKSAPLRDPLRDPSPAATSRTRTPASNGAAPAHEKPPQQDKDDATKYVAAIGAALPTVAGAFTGIHQQLTDEWFVRTLDEVAAEVGPLPRDRLGRGLKLAADQIGRSITNGAIDSPRGFAKSLIVKYLMEQRDGIRPSSSPTRNDAG